MEGSPEFESFYSRHFDAVFGLCLHVLQNEPDAQDAASDAFLWVLKNMQKVTFDTNARSLVMKVAYHKAIDVARKRKRNISESEEIDAPSTSEAFEISTEDSSQVMQSLQMLPMRYRVILILRYRHEMGAAEIADIMNVSVENARMLLCRAHKTLAKTLRGER